MTILNFIVLVAVVGLVVGFIVRSGWLPAEYRNLLIWGTLLILLIFLLKTAGLLDVLNTRI